MIRWARSACVVAVALGALLLCGCGCEGGDSGRWARRILPIDPEWRPESEIPDEPQKTPKMVIWEVSDFAPGTDPTPEQQRAADDLVERSYRAAREHGWFDFQKGLADGYQILFQDRRHYAKREHLSDDHVLDPERPEFLMYYGTPRGKKLAGFMFYVDTPEGRGPQLGGPLTIWHYHIWNRPHCLFRGLLPVGLVDADGRCEEGVASHRSPEMVHVWLLDLESGPFSSSMWIDPATLVDLVDRRESSDRALEP